MRQISTNIIHIHTHRLVGRLIHGITLCIVFGIVASKRPYTMNDRLIINVVVYRHRILFHLNVDVVYIQLQVQILYRVLMLQCCLIVVVVIIVVIVIDRHYPNAYHSPHKHDAISNKNVRLHTHTHKQHLLNSDSPGNLTHRLATP